MTEAMLHALDITNFRSIRGSVHAPLLDDQGVALVLNRAQRLLVGRARTLGQRSARVSLSHGRELTLDPVTLEPQIAAARPRPRKR